MKPERHKYIDEYFTVKINTQRNTKESHFWTGGWNGHYLPASNISGHPVPVPVDIR